LFFTFLIPILIMLAFGMAVPSGGQETPVPVAICDLDQTSYSKLFADLIRDSHDFDVVRDVSSVDEAKELIERGEFPAAIIIPKGFQQRILSPEPSLEITLVLDESKAMIPSMAEAGLAQIAGKSSFGVKVTINRESVTPSGIELSGRAAISSIVMGIALVYSCFDDIAGAMARERERGTLSRLFLTPISRWSIFLGKTLSSILLTQFRTTILLAILVFYLQTPVIGNPLLIYLITSLIATTTIALGFAISTRPISGRSVVILEFALMVPLLFLTGVLRPLEMMPKATRWIAELIPYTYGNDALRRVILLGQGFEFIWVNLAILAAYSMLLFAVAAVILKRKIM